MSVPLEDASWFPFIGWPNLRWSKLEFVAYDRLSWR